MTNQPVDVSIVFPCLNEVQTLEVCIKEAQSALATIARNLSLQGEIVVADNGSTDGSQALATSLGARVVDVEKKGYGNALLGGIEAAYGRYIVMADSDESYDLNDAVPIVKKLAEGYGLCMGSRFKGQIMPGAMPFKNRYIGNPILTGVLNLLFRTGLSDAHSGIRGFTKEAFHAMHLTSPGMEFASEMVIKAALLDIKRTEVPVTLRPDGRDRPPHLRPFRDGWRHLRYIFMLSPAGIYFIPALIMGTIGAFLMLMLNLQPSQTVVQIGPLWFGDHWLMIASMMLTASHQAIIFGLATTLYGIRAGYRRPSKLLMVLYRHINLEKLISTGVLIVGLGILIIVLVFAQWSSQGFGSLDRVREMLAGTTLILIGIQNFFGGFLFAIIAGNEAGFIEDKK